MRITKTLSLTLVTLFALQLSAPAYAISVVVGDINDDDDVERLFDDVRDELEDEIQDIEDDCFDFGLRTDLDDLEDELIEDVEDIYDDARDESGSSTRDEDLDDDEDDQIEFIEDEIDDLRDAGCDSFGGNSRNYFGGSSFYPQTVPSFRSFTTIQPILNFGGFGSFGGYNSFGGYGSVNNSRGTCFNGLGSVVPTQITTLPAYSNFSGSVCTGGFGFGY